MNNQEKNKFFVNFFISRLKSILNFSTDKDVADFLGITPQNLSNYKKRGSFDYEKLFTKCLDDNINIHELFTGFNQDENHNIAYEPETAYGKMNCKNCLYKELAHERLERIEDLKETIKLLRSAQQPGTTESKRHSA